MAQKLTEEQIRASMKELKGWTRDGNKIERSLEFDGFAEAIDFINRIAELADDADHHPEIFNVYNQVDLTLTTHDVGGLSQKDFKLAQQINAEV
jgi:4a-hydroxytetrahydrobiopterin dehydratase